jgi:hypothetical protein
MLIPIIPIIGGAIAAAVTAGGVAIAHNAGKKKGYREGKEIADGQINEYKKRLQELQIQREQAKEGFKSVLYGIVSVPLADESFFSKIATLFRGYTLFHVYVITCISYTRYQVLKNEITGEDAEELRMLVLGLVSSGFPNNLKDDVDAVWDSQNLNEVITTYHKYRGKLGKQAQMLLDGTILSINNYVKQFAELSKQTKEFESLITSA